MSVSLPRWKSHVILSSYLLTYSVFQFKFRTYQIGISKMVRERERTTDTTGSKEKYFRILINTHKTIIIFGPIYFIEMNVLSMVLCVL
jgi:hypothetical protein